ncbi:unnamed protein product [Orchesella dallaii]|uniref:Uncharacterized protein n=1 Tax=Orchesella dallaii TaxID=48710 RepID=A0ABP1RW06_9HEXA
MQIPCKKIPFKSCRSYCYYLHHHQQHHYYSSSSASSAIIRGGGDDEILHSLNNTDNIAEESTHPRYHCCNCPTIHVLSCSGLIPKNYNVLLLQKTSSEYFNLSSSKQNKFVSNKT